MFEQSLAILLPGFLTVIALALSLDDFLRNIKYLVVAGVLCAVLATPWIQPLLHVFGQPQGHLVVPPLFVVIYLVFGRFQWPRAETAFAGTYLSLLLADLVFSTFIFLDGKPAQVAYGAIGGAGYADGLLISPIAGAALTGFLHWLCKRGHFFRFMVGRTAYNMAPTGRDGQSTGQRTTYVA